MGCRVNGFLLQGTSDCIASIFKMVARQRSFDSIELLLHMSRNTDDQKAVTRILYEMARKLKFHSSSYSLLEKLETIEMLSNYVKEVLTIDSPEHLRYGLVTLIESHFHEIGKKKQ